MKRRQALKRLLQTSSGIVATLLPGLTTDKQLHHLFAAPSDPFDQTLTEHRVTPVGEFYVQSYASLPEVDIDQWHL